MGLFLLHYQSNYLQYNIPKCVLKDMHYEELFVLGNPKERKSLIITNTSSAHLPNVFNDIKNINYFNVYINNVF